MDSQNYESHQRIFRELRMHPWMPEHNTFIKAELSKMFVTEPEAAQHLMNQYNAKMDQYISEHPDEFTVSAPAVAAAEPAAVEAAAIEPVVAEPVAPAKPKRTHAKKQPLPPL